MQRTGSSLCCRLPCPRPRVPCGAAVQILCQAEWKPTSFGYKLLQAHYFGNSAQSSPHTQFSLASSSQNQACMFLFGQIIKQLAIVSIDMCHLHAYYCSETAACKLCKPLHVTCMVCAMGARGAHRDYICFSLSCGRYQFQASEVSLL